MSLVDLLNKVVRLNPASRAETKRIHRLNGKIRQVLWNLNYCFEAAKNWDNLTPVEKILLEEYCTIKLL